MWGTPPLCSAGTRQSRHRQDTGALDQPYLASGTGHPMTPGHETGTVFFERVPSFAFLLDQRVRVPAWQRPIRYWLRRILCSNRPERHRYRPCRIIAGRCGRSDHAHDSPEFQVCIRTTRRGRFSTARFLPAARTHSQRRRRAPVRFCPARGGPQSHRQRRSTRVAVQHAEGQFGIGQSRKFESITGSVFRGKPVRNVKIGRFDAVHVEGRRAGLLFGPTSVQTRSRRHARCRLPAAIPPTVRKSPAAPPSRRDRAHRSTLPSRGQYT